MDAPARKQRPESKLIDHCTPAYRVVIVKGGGLSKFAADFDFPVSTVHSWLTKRNGRGKSGLIPNRSRYVEELGREISYQAWITYRGKQLDPPIEFTLEDFADPEIVD